MLLSGVTVNFSRYTQPELYCPNVLRVARGVKHFSSSSRCSTACVSTQHLIARKQRSVTDFDQRKSNSSNKGEVKCASTSTPTTSLPSVEEAPPSKSFSFPLKSGGMVSFFVEEHRDDEEFRIWVNVTTKTLQEPVTLNWGVYREVLDELSPLDEIPEGSTERDDIVCTPLALTVTETRAHGTTEIIIPEYLSPCGVAFNITDCSGILASNAWDPEKPLTFPIGFGTGHPIPLGVKQEASKTNFALQSTNATAVSLVIFAGDNVHDPLLEVAMDPASHRTGDTWHIELPEGILRSFGAESLLYGFRIEGPLDMAQGHRFMSFNEFADPYAKAVSIQDGSMLGVLPLDAETAFTWENDTRPCVPREELVVYELHPAGFTMLDIATSSSREEALANGAPGTFAALIDKIPYLEALGVNAVLLDPVMANMSGVGQDDFWGDLPASVFAPNPAFGSAHRGPQAAVLELKELVKALHSRGIEAWIGARFSNTAEGTDDEPRGLSMRGVDAASYYRMNEDGQLVVHPEGGCALNSSAHVVKQLVLDSLRHWVMEYHIDGFFLHNADELQHGRAGELLKYSDLLESLAMDPVLRAAKLYAGVTSKRPPMPHWEVWGERNPCFRDDLWRFLRGAPNSKGMFATRLCGSADRLGRRGAGYGLNSIAGPKTSTLVDSVDSPLEFAGAEHEEVDTAKPAAPIIIPRGELPVKHRQVRNALLALFLSQGVPVLAMGDEYGHTRGGAPCAPPSTGEPNLFRWDAVSEAGPQAAKHLVHFVRQLSALRKRRPELSSATVHSKCKSRFFGTELKEPDWESTEPQLAVMFTSSDIRSPGSVYCAFNPSSSSATFNLPSAPAGFKWWQLLDTRLMESQVSPISSSTPLTLGPFSAVLLEATTASPPSF